jgi:uncharacterized protein (DUF983 family)
MPGKWTVGSLLSLRCPNCGADTFKAGLYQTAKACSQCGQVFERESGFFAGAIYPFYGGAVVLGGLVMLVFTVGFGWRFESAMAAAGVAVALASPWLFWYSRLSFLHTDHRFFKEGA